MTSYNEAYLDDVVETQGRLFDEVTSFSPGIDVESFIDTYMRSNTRAAIDSGQAYVGTMSAEDLWEFFLKNDNYTPKKGRSIPGFIPDWIGQFYAYYQWYYGMPSSRIIDIVPLEYLKAAYHGLHDLELDLAVKKVGGTIIA
jgi:hypothetical protein